MVPSRLNPLPLCQVLPSQAMEAFAWEVSTSILRHDELVGRSDCNASTLDLTGGASTVCRLVITLLLVVSLLVSCLGISYLSVQYAEYTSAQGFWQCQQAIISSRLAQ
jgi:hypothetical protein